jgi:hypothetical protein
MYRPDLFEQFWDKNKDYFAKIMAKYRMQGHVAGVAVAILHKYGMGGSVLELRQRFCLVACYEKSKKRLDFCCGKGSDVRVTDPVRHLAVVFWKEMTEEFCVYPEMPLADIVTFVEVTGKGMNQFLFHILVSGFSAQSITEELQLRTKVPGLPSCYTEMMYCVHVPMDSSGVFMPHDPSLSMTDYAAQYGQTFYDVLKLHWNQYVPQARHMFRPATIRNYDSAKCVAF